MRLSKGLVALLGGLLACGASVANGDLIVNGSFDSHGGFQSDYQIVVLDNSSAPEGKYGLVVKPANWNINLASFGDHTTADLLTGQMLIANGSANESDRVWSQTVNVHAGWVYDLSFWAASARRVSRARDER